MNANVIPMHIPIVDSISAFVLRISLFPALYIIFPTNFSACSAKTMSHHQSNIEIYSSLETVVFRALPGKRLIIDLPSVGCPVNSPRQPLRVISNPIEQIHNIIIQIVV